MKPTGFSKGDKVIWRFIDTGIPAISKVLRVGFQGIWVKFGTHTCYINPDMVLAYRPATKRRKKPATVRAIR